MLIDTHCHLNFAAFDGRVGEIVRAAEASGVGNFIVPGTDIATSAKSVEIASKFDGVYAAVGIHPHHVYEIFRKSEAQSTNFETNSNSLNLGNSDFNIVSDLVLRISDFLSNPKVVAVGEIGIDRHYYVKTRHENYRVNEEFVNLQKTFFIEQIKLAHKYGKSLIIHNREAKKDVLNILTIHQRLITKHRAVFHCCEPDDDLLEFAKKNNMFIGIDGDITYRRDKREFIAKVPLEMLVIETDSPFLNPEPLRSKYGGMKNEPKNIALIANFVSKLKSVTIDQLTAATTKNAKKLFKI